MGRSEVIAALLNLNDRHTTRAGSAKGGGRTDLARPPESGAHQEKDHGKRYGN
jgi:hypothetical protein